VTDEEIRDVLVDTLDGIAPDIDVASLDPGMDLRRQADLDSVDIASLVVTLHEELGVDVPETDYGELTTLDGAVAYLSRRMAKGPG
jgi:acyl carrier protein